jgi:predicted dehydrogenase
MVVYDDTSLEPVRIFDSGVTTMQDPQSFGEYQLSYRTGPIVSPRVDPVEPLLAEMRDFCTAIRERSTPRASPRLGLDVVAMIEAVERSLTNQGERTPVEEAYAHADTG